MKMICLDQAAFAAAILFLVAPIGCSPVGLYGDGALASAVDGDDVPGEDPGPGDAGADGEGRDADPGPGDAGPGDAGDDGEGRDADPGPGDGEGEGLTEGEGEGPVEDPGPACEASASRSCGSGIGECGVGSQTCDDDGEWGPCEGTREPSPEVCDGLDNNCDGLADDGLPDCAPCEERSVRRCSVNVGECREGVQTCLPAGGWEETCFGGVLPAAEVCDGLDNDCDGDADEGVRDCCLGGEVRSCGFERGACSLGTQVCIEGGLWSLCDAILPSPERCDGVDNNCDGLADDGDPEGGSDCSTGLPGICRAGVETCEQGGLRCIPEIVPDSRAEVCNGLDDNCDGFADDGDPEGGSDCSTGLPGVCRAGVETCEQGGLRCVPEVAPDSRAEACNGLDDDCDGLADEDFPVGEVCRVGVGVCAVAGEFVCSRAGDDVLCDADPGQPDPAGELCDDALDNDCDGATDEGFDELGNECSDGVGACEAAGRFICSANRLALVCDAAAGEPAAADFCGNTEDDDCDGEIDEGDNRRDACPEVPSEGVCENAAVVCEGGVWVCSLPDEFEETEETCDGLDNDCDGVTDDPFRDRLNRPCEAGVGQCRALGVTVCNRSGDSVVCDAVPREPVAAEECNTLDDDCDGETDEGLGLGGQCAAGQGFCRRVGALQCAPNGDVVCSVGPGQPDPAGEACDGSDRDCDGEINDGFVSLGDQCSAGVGICRRTGTFVCNPAAEFRVVRCSVQAGPADPRDLCGDDLDNNCNGLTDEGADEVCPEPLGVCEDAGPVCDGDGLWICQFPDSHEEGDELTCDSLDNDCDGDADELADGQNHPCPQSGVCADRPFVCDEDGGWACDFPPTYEDGEDEATCDGLDNNCDGEVDDGVPFLHGDVVRITFDGGQINPIGNPIENTAPSLAVTDTGYGLCWYKDRAGRCRFLDEEGNFLGQEIVTGGSDILNPAIAWGGGKLCAVFHTTFRCMTPAGVLDAPVELNVAGDALNAQVRPAIVWTGQEFGVAWSRGNGVRFRRLSSAGAFLSDEVNLGGSVYIDLTLAWTGQQFGLAWRDIRLGIAQSEIYFRRVNAAGAVSGGEVRVTDLAGQSDWPALAWNGQEFGLVWSEPGPPTISFASIAGDGEVLDTGTLLEWGGYGLSLAWNGRNYGSALNLRGGGPVYGFLVSSDGGARTWPIQFLDGASADSSLPSSIAWRETEFATSWTSTVNGVRDIWFARGPLGCIQP